MKKKICKIKINNLCKSFGSKVVLKDLNLDLYKGESLVIIGASGTGKSVLLKTILGLMREDSGEIFVDNECVTEMSWRKRQKIMKKFGMLFQGGALFDSLSVWHNVAFTLLHGTSKSGIKYNKKDAKEIAIEKLRAVNLSPDVADRSPAELSGGMQKRVALARAIASEPDMIFFDEPTTGLDPITSTTINLLIRQIVSELGITALAITHDMQSVRAISDRVALLHDGRIMWQGPTHELDDTDDAYVHQFIHGLPEGPMKIIY